MRVPVPNNKLVAFTLVGALLTAVVAGALVLPGGLTQTDEQLDSPGTTAPDASRQVAADPPTPNQDFTPAVKTQSDYEEEDHDEYERDDDDDEEEYDDEHDDDDHDEDE